MASSVIASTGTVADAPGFGQGSHIVYAGLTTRWWCFYITSGSTAIINARYSTDLVTWSTPTNPTFTSSHSNNGLGIHQSVVNANISLVEVVHIGLIDNGGGVFSHVRCTLSGTTITWGTETTVVSNGIPATTGRSVIIGSNNSIWQSVLDAFQNSGIAKSTSLDTGSGWTTGFGAVTTLYGVSSASHSDKLIQLSSGGRIMYLTDNGDTSTTISNIEATVWSGTAWSPTTASDVFATAVSIDPNDWGATNVSDTDIHVVRYEGLGVFTHRRWDGTSWNAGQSIANQNALSGGGVAMVSDGTSVWLFIIDTDAANTVRYCKWSGGFWNSWAALETSTHTRKYITAWLGGGLNKIVVSWAQTNGTNFDFTASFLGLTFIWQQLTDPSAAVPREFSYRTEVVDY